MKKDPEKGRWDGGRFYSTAAGRVYTIRRRVDGQVREFALPPGTSELEARANLALFLRDRAAWVQSRETGEDEAITLRTHLDAYLETLEPRSKKYRSDTENYLNRWAEIFGKKNLKRLTRTEIKSQCPKKAKRNFTAILKTYLGWLVEEGHLKSNPAETIRTDPPKRSEKRKGYPIEFIEKTYAHIDSKPRTLPLEVGGHPVDAMTAQAVRDVFAIAAMHGCHFSEVERLTVSGEIVELNPPNQEIAGYCIFRHKNGDEHRQPLTAQTLAAAKRLKARGSVPVESCVREHLTRAAKSMGLKAKDRLRLSQLRHSFFSNGQGHGTRVITPTGQGASMAELAASAGHRQMMTSFRHYSFREVPSLVLLPYSLRHPNDPALASP